jgi:16S rRNA (cytidine1402-2'-O)-methyltransferase
LAASGLNGQNFAFVGYLPQDAGERAARLKQLESLAVKTGQTQLWIETPYRNAAMLGGLLQSLNANTRLAIASGLTLPSASIQSHTVAQWKKGLKGPDSHTPAPSGLDAGLQRKPAPAMRMARTLPSPTATPKRLTRRSATFSRWV